MPELNELWRAARILSLAADDEEAMDIRHALVRLDRELDGHAPGNVIAAEACLLAVLVAVLRRSDGSTTAPQSPSAYRERTMRARASG